MENKGRGAFLIACYAAAILAPLGWLYFTLLTRNSFRLGEFTPGDLAVCLACGVVPLLCNALAWLLQRRGPVVRGWLPACAAFVVAAAGWIIILSQQWSLWNGAFAAGIIDRTQRNLLRTAALSGLGLSLGALIPVAIRVARFQKES